MQIIYVYAWQQFICYTFILVSGISWNFSKKHNFKRGFLLNFWGIVISFVTYIFTPQFVIWFGILNFLGCSIIIMVFLDRFLSKVSPLAGIILSIITFLLFRNISHGYIGLKSFSVISLPQELYNCKILTPFGFPFPEFKSSDYFPILPWFFLFCTGYYLWNFIKDNEKIQKILFFNIPVLSKIGIHSLPIYLLHQPLLILICICLFKI